MVVTKQARGPVVGDNVSPDVNPNQIKGSERLNEVTIPLGIVCENSDGVYHKLK